MVSQGTQEQFVHSNDFYHPEDMFIRPSSIRFEEEDSTTKQQSGATSGEVREDTTSQNMDMNCMRRQIPQVRLKIIDDQLKKTMQVSDSKSQPSNSNTQTDKESLSKLLKNSDFSETFNRGIKINTH